MNIINLFMFQNDFFIWFDNLKSFSYPDPNNPFDKKPRNNNEYKINLVNLIIFISKYRYKISK